MQAQYERTNEHRTRNAAYYGQQQQAYQFRSTSKNIAASMSTSTSTSTAMTGSPLGTSTTSTTSTRTEQTIAQVAMPDLSTNTGPLDKATLLSAAGILSMLETGSAVEKEEAARELRHLVVSDRTRPGADILEAIVRGGGIKPLVALARRGSAAAH